MQCGKAYGRTLDLLSGIMRPGARDAVRRLGGARGQTPLAGLTPFAGALIADALGGLITVVDRAMLLRRLRLFFARTAATVHGRFAIELSQQRPAAIADAGRHRPHRAAHADQLPAAGVDGDRHSAKLASLAAADFAAARLSCANRFVEQQNAAMQELSDVDRVGYENGDMKRPVPGFCPVVPYRTRLSPIAPISASEDAPSLRDSG